MPEEQAQSIEAELRQARMEAAAEAEAQNADSGGSAVKSAGSAVAKGIKLYRKTSLLRWAAGSFGCLQAIFWIFLTLTVIAIISDVPTLTKIIGQILIDKIKESIGIK